MKVLLEFEITNCNDCPLLTTGRTYGNDGRDGSMVYKCKRGAFGGTCSFGYDTGKSTIPNTIPMNCPLKSEAIEE